MNTRSTCCSDHGRLGIGLALAVMAVGTSGCARVRHLPPPIEELCPDTRARVEFDKGKFTWDADQHELKSSLVPLADTCVSEPVGPRQLCDDRLWQSLLLDHAESLVRWGEPPLDVFKTTAFRTSVDDSGVEAPAVVVRVVENGAGAVLTTKVVGQQRDEHGASWTWRRTQQLSPEEWTALQKKLAVPSLRDAPTYVVRGKAKFEGGGLLGPVLEVYDGKRYRFFVGAEALPSDTNQSKPTWLTNAVATLKEYARCR